MMEETQMKTLKSLITEANQDLRKLVKLARSEFENLHPLVRDTLRDLIWGNQAWPLHLRLWEDSPVTWDDRNSLDFNGNVQWMTTETNGRDPRSPSFVSSEASVKENLTEKLREACFEQAKRITYGERHHLEWVDKRSRSERIEKLWEQEGFSNEISWGDLMQVCRDIRRQIAETGRLPDKLRDLKLSEAVKINRARGD